MSKNIYFDFVYPHLLYSIRCMPTFR